VNTNPQSWPTEGGKAQGRQATVARSRAALRRSRLAMTVVAALVGGSMLSTCETRLRDAVVTGSKDFLFSLLDPSTIVSVMFGDESTP